jgi:hypothetical protein
LGSDSISTAPLEPNLLMPLPSCKTRPDEVYLTRM